MHPELKALEKQSSNIKATAYHDGAVYVQFHSGAVYKYPGVSETTYQDMLGAESVGKFFNAAIRSKFAGSRVEMAPAA